MAWIDYKKAYDMVLQTWMIDCEFNYHDQKIWRTLAYDIWKHWTAVSTLLGLISSVYRDLLYWRSNQWPQNAEPKLYHWASNSHCTQVMSNQLVIVIAQPISLNVSCKLHLYSLQRTQSPPKPHLPRRIGKKKKKMYIGWQNTRKYTKYPAKSETSSQKPLKIEN